MKHFQTLDMTTNYRLTETAVVLSPPLDRYEGMPKQFREVSGEVFWLG